MGAENAAVTRDGRSIEKVCKFRMQQDAFVQKRATQEKQQGSIGRVFSKRDQEETHVHKVAREMGPAFARRTSESADTPKRTAHAWSGSATHDGFSWKTFKTLTRPRNDAVPSGQQLEEPDRVVKRSRFDTAPNQLVWTLRK